MTNTKKRFTVYESANTAGQVPVRGAMIGTYGKLVDAGRAVLATGRETQGVEVFDAVKFKDVRWDAVAKAKGW